ncbi:hypothetical protein EZV62_025635 [Acer yangbiense]|uniref:RING-type domain-containing protein n=1 Tax=Acer yangbiense TaxID=1000413 RepID=A0A5C7GYF4_9ROSI|nr:hypothetical protein EZV62_025635 [Acer yangbiense]
MVALKKTITIAHGVDETTFISVVYMYHCFCGRLWANYSNVRRPLPQNPEARFSELQQFFNEVIPTYKFDRNVGLVWDWTVSCASVSNVFPFVIPISNSTCLACNSTISHAFKSDLLTNNLHDPRHEHDYTCSICLRAFENDEDIRVLPECEHQFHMDCIGKWLFSQSTCPKCRANTPVAHTTSQVIYSVDLRNFDSLDAATYSAHRPLPQDHVAKLRELQQFINEVIPTYKFHKHDGMGSDSTVHRAFMSNSFCFVPPRRICSTCKNVSLVLHPTVSCESGSNFSIDFTREHDSTCSICLREFEDSDELTILGFYRDASTSIMFIVLMSGCALIRAAQFVGQIHLLTMSCRFEF